MQQARADLFMFIVFLQPAVWQHTGNFGYTHHSMGTTPSPFLNLDLHQATVFLLSSRWPPCATEFFLPFLSLHFLRNPNSTRG